MKAIVYTKYGSPDVLDLEEIEKPTPKDDEVLVKVHAASANARDWRLLRADPFLVRLMGGGLLKPIKLIPVNFEEFRLGEVRSAPSLRSRGPTLGGAVIQPRGIIRFLCTSG